MMTKRKQKQTKHCQGKARLTAHTLAHIGGQTMRISVTALSSKEKSAQETPLVVFQNKTTVKTTTKMMESVGVSFFPL